jgi:predicted dehydrogenase
MKNSSSRRDFIKTLGGGVVAVGALRTAAAAGSPGLSRPAKATYMGGFVAPKLETVRCAFIGVGARGGGHCRSFAKLQNTRVVAICDLYQDLADRAAQACVDAGHKNPATYTNGKKDYLRMLERDDIDIVVISTPWKEHAPMAIAAMEAGKHAFIEVPLAVTLQEHWDVVNTSERTGKHCMMMENVNYGRDELMFLNMCRQGVIGELLHGEAAYIHDLRGQMNQVTRGTGSWRTLEWAERNGNLYPTHGLGPVAQYMNIGRQEDLFHSIVSMSSPSVGHAAHPAKAKWPDVEFKGGDMNTSIIKTHLGRTIMVQWDETSPRPYTRHNLIQGSKGTLAGFPTRLALESKNAHHWIQGGALQEMYATYEHPLWKRMGEEALRNGGHGGMDYIMRARIIECLTQGEPLDQNVYEGAFWSVVGPLSEASVAKGGAPQKFPDFTRGAWQTTMPLPVIS